MHGIQSPQMEMGSTYFTESGGSSSSPPNSSEFINGLKFGQKIYFEDAGFGAPLKFGGGSSSSGGSGGSVRVDEVKKRRGGVVRGGQPPRCLVEGCNVDLSDAKAYYSRHKVCGIHSKTSKVIVAGIEQRFCQQCSRFHRLPEFDEGKRSCRRRLAGHNERRRKPSPGSIFSSSCGRHPSSIFENSGRGSFLMNFTAYPTQSIRNSWQTSTSKVPSHQWQINSERPPSNIFQHGSASGISYPGPEIPPEECFTGVPDTSCALSLLSIQPRDTRNYAWKLGANNLMNPQSAAADHLTGSGTHKMPPDPGLGHFLQPVNSPFSSDLELLQQSRNHCMEFEHSKAYDTTQQMHWSL